MTIKVEPFEPKLTVDFTPEEAQVLVNLIDVAIRARGLEAAQAGYELAARLQAAIKTAGAITSTSFTR